MAEDQDVGGGGEVRYSLLSQAFLVDMYSGWITTLEPLDREVTPFHTLLLTAVDSGHPSLTSTATLHVTVVDYNDTPPRFSSDKYSASGKFLYTQCASRTTSRRVSLCRI